MIYKDGKQISSVSFGQKVITAIYHGARVVWEAISSCFGKGYWINEEPWDNDDGWTN